ncbi:large ribosomal subunit protein mL40-like [Watersipora subatra]|uniref:large ribosomal subunit protein mL40-like n=1 Tax=Watersipora subatra TaxID=2589382 RepID=UPI00355B5CA7
MLSLRGFCQRVCSGSLHGTCLPTRSLHASPVLCGEPLKRKKRVDPAILRMQLERKKKRLEKQIRQQLKFARKLKPIDDYELHRELPKDSGPRPREEGADSMEERLRRQQLCVEWSHYKYHQSLERMKTFSNMIKAQEKALAELKIASTEKYDMAVQKDDDILEYSFTGPTETPPIVGYVQDGKYTETTKSYDLDPEIVKLMLEKNTKLNLESKKAAKDAKRAAKG